jgi:hypothetical protein
MKKIFVRAAILAVISTVLTFGTVLACTYLLNLKINPADCGKANVEAGYWVSDHGYKVKAELYIDGGLVDSKEITSSGSNHEAKVSFNGPLAPGSHTVAVYGYKQVVDVAKHWGPWEAGKSSNHDDQNQYIGPVYACPTNQSAYTHDHGNCKWPTKIGGHWKYADKVKISDGYWQHRHWIGTTYKWSSPVIKSDTLEVASCTPLVVTWEAVADCNGYQIDGYVNGNLWFNTQGGWIDGQIMATFLFDSPESEALYGPAPVIVRSEVCLPPPPEVCSTKSEPMFVVASEWTFEEWSGMEMRTACYQTVDAQNGNVVCESWCVIERRPLIP